VGPACGFCQNLCVMYHYDTPQSKNQIRVVGDFYGSLEPFEFRDFWNLKWIIWVWLFIDGGCDKILIGIVCVWELVGTCTVLEWQFWAGGIVMWKSYLSLYLSVLLASVMFHND
jgi:hypothetical protein